MTDHLFIQATCVASTASASCCAGPRAAASRTWRCGSSMAAPGWSPMTASNFAARASACSRACRPARRNPCAGASSCAASASCRRPRSPKRRSIWSSIWCAADALERLPEPVNRRAARRRPAAAPSLRPGALGGGQGSACGARRSAVYNPAAMNDNKTSAAADAAAGDSDSADRRSAAPPRGHRPVRRRPHDGAQDSRGPRL